MFLVNTAIRETGLRDSHKMALSAINYSNPKNNNLIKQGSFISEME